MKSNSKITEPTAQENTVIEQQAVEDNTVLTDVQLQEMKPASEVLSSSLLNKLKRGRPKASITKVSTTVRFTKETLEYFKSTGKGWQTRMDEVLTEYAKTHH